MLCQFCGETTDNPKFCSSSCSAKSNNRKRNTRRKNKCADCSELILSSHVRCKFCDDKRRYQNSIQNKTLGEINLSKGSNKFSAIRGYARKIARYIPNKCSCCGYTRHVEVCHIKDISSFSKDTLVSQINSIDNLVKLCPNCHWEFDKGRLINDGGCWLHREDL